MIAVALKGLAGRKIRALLTAFAVVIGVSMVSGTLILTDTMQKTFDGLFAASYDETDAVIGGKQIVEKSLQRFRPTVPESLLAKVRDLPQVESAAATAAMLKERALRNDYEALVVVAPPATLGELRKHYHKEVEKRLVAEVPKDLVNVPVAEIEEILKDTPIRKRPRRVGRGLFLAAWTAS